MKTGMALSAIFAAGTLLAPLNEAQAANPLRIETTKGPVRGFYCTGTATGGPAQRCTVPGTAAFLGIPYAKAPVGSLRWVAPQPHAKWTSVLVANRFANTCAQIVTLGVFAGPANINEDCLYLNVFTPNLSPTAKLPVIFWIHGGGNVDGESNDYDGSKLANLGNTVVVTINYRLNLFGFLAHPVLDTQPLWGNYGILDQQLALKWVRQNIANFGGDKNNIAMGGQSAGASDTSVNVVSPLAAGMFQRAIYESAVSVTWAPLARALNNGIAFATAAGCVTPPIDVCLRNLTAAQVLALAGTASANSAYITGPIVDGTIIPKQAVDAWTSGAFSHMPMMNGRVHDEQNFTLAIAQYFKPGRPPFTTADYVAGITAAFSPPNPLSPGVPYPPGTALQVLAEYPTSGNVATPFNATPPPPQIAWDRAITEMGNCATRHINKILGPQVPYYAYQFDEITAPFYFPKMTLFTSLAYHTSDIQYLFVTYHGGPAPPAVGYPPLKLNAKQTTLSDQLVGFWTRFASTGNPNGVGNTPWPRFTLPVNAPAVLSENIPANSTYTDAQFAANNHCAASGAWPGWDAILPYTYGSTSVGGTTSY
jgi:para-nitrobenzyl esterase